MANQQQQENIRLQEAKKLIQDINRLRVQMNQEPLKLGDTEAVKNIQSLRNEFKQLARDIGDVDNSASNLFEQMVGIAKEFGAVNKPANQLKSAFKGLVEQAGKLKNDELGLLDLRTRDLESIEKKLGLAYEAARVAASQFTGQEALIQKAEKAREEETKQRNHINKLKQAAIDLEAQGNDNGAFLKLKAVDHYEKQILGVQRARVKLEKGIKPEAKAALAFLKDQEGAYKGIHDTLQVRKGQEKEISRLTGVTGALVGGTGALMERLGMRSGIFHDAMKDSAAEMRAMAKSTAEGGEKFNKLQIAAKGFSTLAKGFGGALNDPASAALAIVTAFFEVNKAQTEFIQLTGQSAASLGGVNTEVASMTDLLKTAAEFTKQTGLNAATIFTPQQIGQIADATQLLGVSAEQARTLGMVMKQTGKSADDIGNAIYDNVDAGISQKVVYDDVLSASDDIVASSGGNVEALGRAASAARKLGMDLAKINQIADGLMNFEDSIGNELEAQLLTGKNINLSKARELALNNDLEGVAKELEKNGASAAEYAGMNRIQQTAMAKAMGMSRAELGKMVLTQEAMSNMTADQIAAARGVTLEQSKQMDIQSKIKKSMDRLAQAFAPILEAIVPIVDVMLNIIRPVAAIVGWLLKWKAVTIPLTVAFGLIAGYMAANKIASFVGIGVKGFTAMTASITKMGGGLKGVGGLAKKAANGIKDSFQGGLGKKVQSKAGDWYGKDSSQGKMITNMKKGGGDKTAEVSDAMKKTSKTSEDAGKVKEGTGAKIQEFFTGLAAGLKEMKSKDVLKGALNALLSAPALISLGIASPGLYIMSKIKGKGIEDFFTGLGNGLAAIGKRFGEVVKGSLALGIAGVIIGGSFALALKMVEGVDPAQMLAFSTSIAMFGITLALIGKSSSSVIKGALAMGILGVALIPAAFAFKLLEGVNPGQMFAFAGAVTLLGLAAAGLGFLIGPIAMGSAALALLGLALIPMTYGLSLLEGVDIGTIFSFAAGIGILGTTAALLGTAAPLIIAGSAALAVLGLALTPIAHGLSLIGDVGVETIIGFASGIAILGTTAALLGTAAPLIIAGSIAIAALGLALIPVTHAFSLLGDTPIETIVDKLQGLATMAPQLLLVGVALMSIAAGLGMIAMTGIAAIPALMALSTFAIVVTPLASIVGDLFGGEGGGEDNSMAEISAKLDTLISVVSKGGDVFLDGNKVGETLAINSYKSS